MELEDFYFICSIVKISVNKNYERMLILWGKFLGGGVGYLYMILKRFYKDYFFFVS